LRPFPCLIALLALLCAPSAFAQTEGAQAAAASASGALGENFVSVGLGLAVMPDYEGSNDYRALPMPGAIGRVRGYNFVYLGNRLSVDLIRHDRESRWDIQLGPVAAVGLNRTSLNGIHDSRVRALGKVNPSVELGGYAGIARWGVITSDYDRLSATLTVRHDVAGGHGGTIITPSISYMTPLSTTAMIGLYASANHADDHYAGAYYSISPAQSGASGLPAFGARGGWKDWTLAAAGNVSLTGNLTHGLSLVGGVAYTRLLNDFADSPVTSIAGSRAQWMAGMGLAYTF
jgi:outer membrane scaffolding protein for murein synthesis (MipA/OmpV family)